MTVAEQGASELEEAEVDVGVAFPADSQAAWLMEPAEAAFDDPAERTDPGVVLVAAVGDRGGNATFPEHVPVFVVGTIGIDRIGSAAGPPALPAHGWKSIGQRDQLHHVVVVSSGQRHRQWCSARVGDHVVLSSPAGLGRPDSAPFGPPRIART